MGVVFSHVVWWLVSVGWVGEQVGFCCDEESFIMVSLYVKLEKEKSPKHQAGLFT